VQDAGLGAGVVEPGNLLPHEVDSGRQDEAVVAQVATAGQAQAARRRVDRQHLVVHDAHPPVALQAIIAERDVGHAAAATDDQIGHRAGDEAGRALDQRDLDAARAPHAQVLRRRGAAVAAADDNDVAARLSPAAAGAAREGEYSGQGAGLQKSASVAFCHVSAPYFCAAK